MFSKALKTLAGIAVILSSTAALATFFGGNHPAHAVQVGTQTQAVVLASAADARNAQQVATAFNDIDMTFTQRARAADRADGQATGLPELDNWMLLAAGGLLILVVTRRRMRDVND
jgi:hypothetical protein